VPDAFGDHGLAFAVAYGAVRAAQIAVFVLASRGDAGLRHSVVGLGLSTAAGVGLLVGGSLLGGDARAAVWAAALVFDMAAPLVIDSGGWRLVPGHFAERHGLIVIVALGESIVAIGVGAGADVDGGVIVAAVLGVAVASALWWVYFDVSALVAGRRLAEIEPGVARNRLARDAYSYLHLPMVAAIVLIALGMKSTLAHVGDPLRWETATALVGGAALYLLAHVVFKLRALSTLSVPRLVAAVILVAVIPVAHRVEALATVGVVAGLLWATILFEGVRHAEARRDVRQAEHLRHSG
jgi:low temperature requirement protein LtrA